MRNTNRERTNKRVRQNERERKREREREREGGLAELVVKHSARGYPRLG